MWRTYGQVRPFLKERSLVVFDRGANDKDNLDRTCLDRNDHLTAKKLNTSDDRIFDSFSKGSWELIDAEDGIYALKRTFPSRVNYYFFSEKLKKDSSEVASSQGGVIAGRSSDHPTQPGQWEEIAEAVPHQQSSGGRQARPPAETSEDGQGGISPPPRGGHRWQGRILLT